MMTFLHPFALILLPLALLPFVLETSEGEKYSWIDIVPKDPLSITANKFVKLIFSLIIVGILFALSSPKGLDKKIQKSGKGAQTVMVIDRSVSMDDPFAGNVASGHAAEIKSAAARRIITQFIDSRKDDMMGVVGFTNSALYGSKITNNRDAIHSAIHAATSSGINQTNIGAGITQAVSLFDNIENSGSRAVILLSDGAGKISPRVKHKIQEELEARKINLYWIVIRDPEDVSIFATDRTYAEDSEPAAIALDKFFKTLKIKYTAYEADSSTSLQSAISDIDSREKKSIKYWMSTPGHDYSTDIIWVVLILSTLLFGVKNLRLYS